MTSVQILDHDMTRFTNIEAQVYYPEDDGVVQVEHFGIHARMVRRRRCGLNTSG